MADIYFYSLLLPLFFVPVLFLFKCIGKSTAIWMWTSFLFAALTDSLTDNALVSLSVLILCFFAYFLYKKGVFVKSENQNKIAIVIGKNSKSGEIIFFDGSKIFKISSLDEAEFSSGDIATIKNYKKMQESV